MCLPNFLSFRPIQVFVLMTFIFLLGSLMSSAHPMPNSIVLLDIHSSSVNAELQLPLSELELAFGHKVNENSEKLVERLGKDLRTYILSHVLVRSKDGAPWHIEIINLKVEPIQKSESGPYKELTVQLVMTPALNESTREFTFGYDVIIHQVVSHFALVSIRNDWERGLSSGHPAEIGVIRLDVVNNVIPPLEVNLSQGSTWTGFANMVNLGIDHIYEGNDHLLFLLVLLLPAPLMVSAGIWKGFAGVKSSLMKILKIVSAFTVGHSVTLLIGTLGWIHFPEKPIEVLIGISILISAIHALKPIFPGKELFIAGGFGLVHGMAFASTLVNLHLETTRLILSILGFNIGIELMQLFVIAITLPWLIVLAYNNFYRLVRVFGAAIAAIAAVAWIAERISEKPNMVTVWIARGADYAQWLILLLALLSTISFFVIRNRRAIKQS